jgi:hypothetical protein
LLVVVLRTYLRLGNPLFDERQVDPNLVRALLGAIGGMAVIWMFATSRQLARWLGLTRWGNPYVVLRESAASFEEKGIRSNFFGPYLSTVPGRPKGALEEDEDETEAQRTGLVVEQRDEADQARER